MTKAVILAVDDEPEVLSAVERDLRRHFRSEYLVMKARSGSQALEAIHTLKERESPVALFLVDERMPRMSGTEFPREARQVFPRARKVARARCCSPRTRTRAPRSWASTTSGSTTT